MCIKISEWYCSFCKKYIPFDNCNAEYGLYFSSTFSDSKIIHMTCPACGNKKHIDLEIKWRDYIK